MIFKNQYNDYLKIIENRLENIDFKMDYDNKVSEGSRYAILNQGKRIRPILLLEFCKIFSESTNKALDFAVALELIHNYSLVHDDLPSMDDDNYRRENLTVHAKYGEDIGILVGDTLLNKSYEIIIKDILTDRENSDSKLQAANYIAVNSGIKGMIGGQVYDIDNRFNNVDELLEMYNKKTCGLIRSACVAGAYIGGASDEEIHYAEEFGKNLGLAFQIKDDLLDLKEDEKINKTTYVSLTNKKIAEDKVKEYSERAEEILDKLGNENVFLKSLIDELVYRKK